MMIIVITVASSSQAWHLKSAIIIIIMANITDDEVFMASRRP